MPRSKVNPANRKRSLRACIPCRASKIRCDGVEPCARCRKRGRIGACSYPEFSQSPVPVALDVSSTPTQGGLTPLPAIRDGSIDVSNSAKEGRSRRQPQYDVDTSVSNAESKSAVLQNTSSRMLLNAKGERGMVLFQVPHGLTTNLLSVFIGETAALSYLQFVRQIMRQCMGSSVFTENDLNQFMLEVEPPSSDSVHSIPFDAEEKRGILESYKEATSGILDLLTRDEIKTYIAASDVATPIGPTSKRSRASLAMFDLALAIGIQSQGTDRSASSLAAIYFSSGQRHAFEGLLCDPSLDMVALFLLMAFYQLGACRRNSAFMYLGVASKSASALGLHRKEQYALLPKEECSVRLRIWMSLCVLDTIVSAILGRSGSLFAIWPDESGLISSDADRRHSTTPTLDATYRMCALIDALEQDIGKGRSINSNSAESFLHQLRRWSRRLPPELQKLTATAMAVSNAADREVAVGAAHVACSYYFAVILATRPFFTSHLLLKLHERGFRLQGIDHAHFTPEERLKIAHLAQVCLDAASYMSKLMRRALDAGLLLRNMCLIKAWVFAAGLLLGFSMFAEEGSFQDTEEAFGGAQAVLLHLSILSPQAKHYHDILSSLSDAVKSHRQQRVDEKRRMTNMFLDPIFTIDFDDGVGPVAGREGLLGGDDVARDLEFDPTVPGQDLNVDVSGALPMLWDDFSGDWQAFDMSLDSNWVA